MRSESCLFIWHPNVRMQNVKFVNGVCMGSFSANLGDWTVGIVA